MINSKNLLHVFKHNFVTSKELTEFLKVNPNTEKRVGCLPSDWLKKIDKTEISKVTQLVDDVFEKSAYEFSYKTFDESTCKQLAKTLKKILKRQDISVEKVGSGAFKVCHRLTVGMYSYALSTFKANTYNTVYRTTHGRGSEPQNIFTAYRRMSHGRVSKPFMAKVAPNNELNGGYILCQFIGKDKTTFFQKFLNTISKRKKINIKQKSDLTPLEIKLQDFEIPDSYFGFNYKTKNACVGNVINGVLIDVGGMKQNEFKLNNSEKKIALNLEQKVMAESSIICQATNNNIDVGKISNYICDVLNDGIDIYTADLREIFKDLKPEEQKVAIKIVRLQKRLIKFLDSLNDEEKDCYENALKSINVSLYNITRSTKRLLYH